MPKLKQTNQISDKFSDTIVTSEDTMIRSNAISMSVSVMLYTLFLYGCAITNTVIYIPTNRAQTNRKVVGFFAKLKTNIIVARRSMCNDEK